jgi:sorting nexin-1/2
LIPILTRRPRKLTKAQLIEKWETFLMQLDAEDDETVFYRPPVIQTTDKATSRGDTAVDRARATIDEDSD